MSSTGSPTTDTAAESPLSLRRLTSALASMLGHKSLGHKPAGKRGDDETGSEGTREVETGTRSITEALLFVGNPENEPLSASDVAATMRDVSAEEVAHAVAELNADYEELGAPYTIAESAAGFRMILREEFGAVRDKFHGKVRQGKLSPAAMEVLSVVAYRQPARIDAIDALRGGKSQSLVSGLVRRGLLRLERPSDDPKLPHYVTTDQFLRLFRLTSIDQLPQAEEFDGP